LVYNICRNLMDDMDGDRIQYNPEEYDRYAKAAEDAERFFARFGEYNSPISWFIWRDYSRAKELIVWAENHRMDACEKAGIHYMA
ncbi:MAG: hypothetical protein ACI4CX_00025, partial [Candidatus Weimeria sp.]